MTAADVSFDAGELQALVEKIKSGTEKYGHLVDRVWPTANATLKMPTIELPDWLYDAIMWTAQHVWEIEVAIYEKLKWAALRLGAPHLLSAYIRPWNDVKNEAAAMAEMIKDPSRGINEQWKGPAQSNYMTAISRQKDAVDRIGAMAGRTADTVLHMVLEGVAFLVAIAPTLTGALALALMALGILATPAALAAAGAMLKAAAAVVAALALAFVPFAAGQWERSTVLQDEAANPTGFGGPPVGKWPVSVTPGWTVEPRPDREDWDPK
jgi:hypothetical protein